MWKEMSYNKYSNRNNEFETPDDYNYCGILEDITRACCFSVEDVALAVWDE